MEVRFIKDKAKFYADEVHVCIILFSIVAAIFTLLVDK